MSPIIAISQTRAINADLIKNLKMKALKIVKTLKATLAEFTLVEAIPASTAKISQWTLVHSMWTPVRETKRKNKSLARQRLVAEHPDLSAEKKLMMKEMMVNAVEMTMTHQLF